MGGDVVTRQPRFEIVRSDADQPWHARFRAANGAIVWSTEQYDRCRAAENAVRLMMTTLTDGHWWKRDNVFHVGMGRLHAEIEARYVDERGKS